MSRTLHDPRPGTPGRESRRDASQLGTLLLALVALLALACGCAASGPADEGPLWADPGVVRFDPTRTRATIAIHNKSGTVRPIRGFALAGDDWDALRIVDESLPRTIGAHDSVEIQLELSTRPFMRSEAGETRGGQALLRFESDSHEYELPLRFEPDARGGPRLGPLATLLFVVALALVGAAWMTGKRPAAWSEASKADLPSRAIFGSAFAAQLLVLALVPVGAGLCYGRTATLVGPRELAQCRAGLVGTSLVGLPASPGLWWILIALCLAGVLVAAARVRTGARLDLDLAARVAAMPALRVIGLGAIVVALICGLAPAGSSPADLALAQTRPTSLLGLPAWGVVAQPLGAALALALAVGLPAGPAAGASPKETPPGQALLEQLDTLAWSGLLVTLFLGGWTVPLLSQRPVPLLSHGAILSLELAAVVVKIGLVALLIGRGRALLRGRGVSVAAALRVHTRWTIPLALLHALALAWWRAQ